MGHIFISYSHKDSSYVHKLARDLEREGFEVWFDDLIHYGSEWPKVVTKNLDVSDGVIVVLSNNSDESDMVHNEVTRAREKKKPIFTLLLEGENWLIVQTKQFVDVRDGSLPTEKFYKRLEAITTRKNEGAEREAVEKAARQKAKREATEKVEREKVERATREKLEPESNKLKNEISAERIGTKKEKFRLSMFIISVVGLMITIVFTFILLELNPQIVNSSTLTPGSTPADVYTITPTPLLTEITDAKGVSMMLVPASEFVMGSDNSNPDEKPVHTVYLNAFYIDKFEVTNAYYKACVDAGKCDYSQEQNTGSVTRSSYFSDSEFDNYPVIHIYWQQAKTYCEWRGGGLPTEAQWEKAARGIDGRTYPWGEDIACIRASWRLCASDTTEVGSYESGKGPYGIYDLAGNVWEWVADWYSENYYQDSPSSNPVGPDSGQYRVVRGGAWTDLENALRASNRGWADPNDPRTVDIGLRCARSIDESITASEASTPIASHTIPATYTLQKDEYAFCIARRLNIDPADFLQASNLSSPDIYYAGLVLTIPQNSVWPVQDLGPRALRPHPATYSVTGNADTTVHGVACKFGDVTPDSIVGANSGLSLGSTLTVGQNLNIP